MKTGKVFTFLKYYLVVGVGFALGTLLGDIISYLSPSSNQGFDGTAGLFVLKIAFSIVAFPVLLVADLWDIATLNIFSVLSLVLAIGFAIGAVLLYRRYWGKN